MNLYQANAQWANRPQDERFNSLEAMYTATRHYAACAVEKTRVAYKSLRVEAQAAINQVGGGK